MPEIGALLHDAVPPDDSEPDLDEIAYLAGRRRRRRRTARIVFPLVVLAIVVPGLWVFGGGDEGRPDVHGDDVVIDEATTTTAPSSTTTSAPVPAPSASALARLLGVRPLTQTTRFAIWPLTPEEFFGQFPPDQAVVGTLAEVGPGPVLHGGVCHDGRCIDAENLETVVDVERWLGPGRGASGRLAVPWQLGAVPIGAEGDEAEEATSEAAVPYQDAAPLGARVLVLLQTGDVGAYDWYPSAVSAIVIEDGDGVAVPHGTDVHQPIDFDDYVARVEELLQQQG